MKFNKHFGTKIKEVKHKQIIQNKSEKQQNNVQMLFCWFIADWWVVCVFNEFVQFAFCYTKLALKMRNINLLNYTQIKNGTDFLFSWKIAMPTHLQQNRKFVNVCYTSFLAFNITHFRLLFLSYAPKFQNALSIRRHSFGISFKIKYRAATPQLEPINKYGAEPYLHV